MFGLGLSDPIRGLMILGSGFDESRMKRLNGLMLLHIIARSGCTDSSKASMQLLQKIQVLNSTPQKSGTLVMVGRTMFYVLKDVKGGSVQLETRPHKKTEIVLSHDLPYILTNFTYTDQGLHAPPIVPYLRQGRWALLTSETTNRFKTWPKSVTTLTVTGFCQSMNSLLRVWASGLSGRNRSPEQSA